ncbi:uncharacterized protein K441DRAFT_668167 [Cenococcum geophilum 1.58]|uniref:uncharacterized protein n=1 Tax=Cenococcum geophilum 1.58 TaxID=794803 RepID=UPI00358FCA05|nr:hypothetical protein K441DRAFT_668167 [Cenococcum geophilum 1.58]
MSEDYGWTPFIIPKHLLTSPITLSSPLLCLPNELLFEIFHHTDLLGRLCLAFTCKHLLQVSASASLRKPRPVLQRGLCLELLRLIEPLNARGRPKMSWAVCHDCLRYRPTKKCYWATKRRDWVITKNWQKRVNSWKVTHFLQYSEGCPECYYWVS